MMTNGDPEGQIFLSYPTRIMDSFSCSPLFFFIYIFAHLFIFIYLFILKYASRNPKLRLDAMSHDDVN